MYNYVKDYILEFISSKNWELTKFNKHLLLLTLTDYNGEINKILIPSSPGDWRFYSSKIKILSKDQEIEFDLPKGMSLFITSKMLETNKLMVKNVETNNIYHLELETEEEIKQLIEDDY
jgi:hypothetical protein